MELRVACLRKIKNMIILDTLEDRSDEGIAEQSICSLVMITADLSKTAESIHGFVLYQHLPGHPPLLFSKYFGAMPAFTQEYENIPEHRVNREMTLEYAMFELATKLQEIKERAHGVTPLFFSTNVNHWTRPLLNSLLERFPNYANCFGSLIDVRALFSVESRKAKILYGDTIEQCLSRSDKTKKQEGLEFICDFYHRRVQSGALRPEVRAMNAYASGLFLLQSEYTSEDDD